MSDEDDFMPSCDSQDYDFGYSDEGPEGDQIMDEDPGDDPENAYYQSKGHRETEPETAIKSFAQIIETSNGTEIAVKASKQTLKLVVRNPGLGSVSAAYNQFIESLLSSPINQSYRDQSFMNMVEVIRNEPEFGHYLQLAAGKFKQTKGCERLASRIIIRLADMRYSIGEYEQSLELLDQFQEPGSSGAELWKTSLGLESLALRIQIAIKQGNGQEEQLYDLIRPGSEAQMAHPRILAVIRECGGIIAIRRRRWAEARTMLLKAFKSYDEAGLPDRLRVLQYYIVCSILTEIGINPFDSQETLAYKDFPQFNFLQKLVQAFMDMDLAAFKMALAGKATTDEFCSDQLVSRYLIPELHVCFQRQLLIKVLNPFSRVSFDFVAKKLEVSVEDVPQIITRQILAGKLPNARIDDSNKVIEFTGKVFSGPAPASLRLQLPARYREFAAHNVQDAFEKSIISAEKPEEKQKPDFSRVHTDLVGAIGTLHSMISGEQVHDFFAAARTRAIAEIGMEAED